MNNFEKKNFDPQGDVLICAKHLARAMRLVQITLPRR